jgi:hypothetical protein
MHTALGLTETSAVKLRCQRSGVSQFEAVTAELVSMNAIKVGALHAL